MNFPGQLLDIRAAIRWLREHADEYNIDPNRFAIMGTSSGGWLAAIAATTSDIWEFDGENDVQTSSAVQAAVPCFAPTDFLQMDEWYAEHGVFSAFIHDAPLTPLPPNDPPLPPWIFDPVGCSPESLLIGCTNDDGYLLGIQDYPEATQAANPITYIDDDEPLMCIFHGYTDPLVPHGQSELLYEALVAEGNEVWFTSVADGVHDLTTIIDASDYTVYRTNRWGREWVWEDPYGPAPTLQNINFFIRYAFIRARWGAGMHLRGPRKAIKPSAMVFFLEFTLETRKCYTIIEYGQ